jgi:hypothetical protein
MSVIQTIGLSAQDLARVLVELHSEGEVLPPGAFDELAEASMQSHADASEAVLNAVDPAVKVRLGLALARTVLRETAQKRRA